ncbi:ATP-grasp domain-containing protein [Streptomyces sp. M2CJ-2]|uniref:ATP-grasp domain-containing protein n=1 Tax=Streptomyces sp. M2CJ-2 TaxID=2803948 RepID=UPI001F3B147E|nr:ATP-grasp domain-containing protein [Streptomyces sp. M2CJ-2]
MNPERTLVLVGGTDETVKKACGLGLSVLLLQHPTKVSEEQNRLATAVEVVDYTDWALVEPVVRAWHESPGFTVATSLTEPGLENAGRVNDLLGLHGTGYEVTRRFRDKAVMRRYLAEHDPARAVRAQSLHSREDLGAFGASYGFPFVVKPADATASIGVQCVEGPDDTGRVWDEVDRLVGTRTDRVSSLFVLRDFLMEEYLDGPEFSVESFSFAGRHVIVAITEKFTAEGHFAELGHAVPARLPARDEDALRDAVRGFLDVMGLRDGVCHTEVRLTARGPRVIESHNRIAGDVIPELVHGAYGIDLISLALSHPFGLAEELPDRPRSHGGACVRALVGAPGARVESVAGVEEARGADGVIDVRISARPGDTVRPLRDNWDRLGLVAVAAGDTDAAVRRGAEVVEEHLRIVLAHPDGRTGLAQPAGTGEHANLLILHRNPLDPFPYRAWLPDHTGDIVVLAARDKIELAGEKMPDGALGYTRLEIFDDFDADEVDARALELAAAHGVTHVIALHEADLLRAARLRERLGLPGAWHADVLPFRDKALMKARAQKAGIAVAPYVQPRTTEQARRFAAAQGFPLVFKHRHGFNSVGLRILRDEAAFEECLKDAYGAGEREDVLLEGFVPGRMCHVDGFVADGRPAVAWPSQYQYDLASFASDPGPRIDVTLDRDDPLTPRLLNFAEKVLATLTPEGSRLRDYAFHMEVFHTPDDQLVLCESACRSGGAKIREVFHTLFGVHLGEYAARAEAGHTRSEAMRELTETSGLPAPRCMSGQMLTMKRPGLVRALPPEPDEPWLTGFWLFAEEGQAIAPAAGSADFLAAAVGSAPTRAECERRLRALGDWVREHTEIAETAEAP